MTAHENRMVQQLEDLATTWEQEACAIDKSPGGHDDFRYGQTIAINAFTEQLRWLCKEFKAS